jgi:hypothetical protein
LKLTVFSLKSIVIRIACKCVLYIETPQILKTLSYISASHLFLGFKFHCSQFFLRITLEYEVEITECILKGASKSEAGGNIKERWDGRVKV